MFVFLSATWGYLGTQFSWRQNQIMSGLSSFMLAVGEHVAVAWMGSGDSSAQSFTVLLSGSCASQKGP